MDVDPGVDPKRRLDALEQQRCRARRMGNVLVAVALSGLVTVGILLSVADAVVGGKYEELKGRREACEIQFPSLGEVPLPYRKTDFDGDGKPETFTLVEIEVEYPKSNRQLVVSDADGELLRIPYFCADGTLRTHVAIDLGSSPCQVLVFDPLHLDSPYRAAYSFNGRALAPASPSERGGRILDALACDDDRGTRDRWLFYRVGRILALACYLVLSVAVLLVCYKFSKSSRPEALNAGSCHGAEDS